jgi:hypothetical protein
MKQDRSSLYRALFLVLGCIVYRLASGTHPEALPNISPMIAVALVGSMYLPRAWGWLITPVAFVVTELAFLATNYRAAGFTLSWSMVAFLVFYMLVGGLGLALARNKSLLKIVAGSILCSVVFYVVANTFAWLGNSSPMSSPSYLPTLSGWWQANTVGLPGWQPTWTFLRNGVLGDLFFAGVLLAIFDRELLLHPLRSRGGVTSSAAS